MTALDELWPDPDRRDAALERLLARIHGVAYRNGSYAPLPKQRTEPRTREEYRAMGQLPPKQT